MVRIFHWFTVLSVHQESVTRDEGPNLKFAVVAAHVLICLKIVASCVPLDVIVTKWGSAWNSFFWTLWLGHGENIPLIHSDECQGKFRHSWQELYFMVQVRLGLRDCLTHFSLPFSCVDLRSQQLAQMGLNDKFPLLVLKASMAGGRG